MSNQLFWMAQGGAILFSFSGILALWGLITKKSSLRDAGLFGLTLLGPITLGLCWKAQILLMTHDAVPWSRLMAGDLSKVWVIGSVGIIAGTGVALAAMALQSKTIGILLGAIAYALMWTVFYLHPTPHYVPIPAWLDKLIWFGLTVGGAIACLTIYLKFKSQLKIFQTPVAFAASVLSAAALLNPVSVLLSMRPLDISALEPSAQISALGCLSCHSMGEVGYPEPGGGLESVASRKEDSVRAFLADPSAENAQKLGIRENPTGEMAGVRLTSEQVDAITEALKSLFDIQPPSTLGPGWDHIEPILTEKTCMACHTLKGEGAPQGGIGGPIEAAAKRNREILIEWLQDPSFDKATSLKIRETPLGAMMSFPLPEEQAKQVADWILSLESE